MDLGALGFLLLGIAVYLGFSLWCFVHFLRKYLRWRRNTPISGGKQACIILPPVLLILALFLPMLARLPEELPASREELKELTAQVDAAVRVHAAAGRQVRQHLLRVPALHLAEGLYRLPPGPGELRLRPGGISGLGGDGPGDLPVRPHRRPRHGL